MSNSRKQELARQCYQEVFNTDPPESYLSKGGTVSKELISDIATQKGITNTDLDKVSLAKRVSDHLNMPWNLNYDSESSTSGGGGTLTASYYEDLLDYL